MPIECMWYDEAPDGPWTAGMAFPDPYRIQLSNRYRDEHAAGLRPFPIAVVVPTRNGGATWFGIDCHPTDKPLEAWDVIIAGPLVAGARPPITVAPSMHAVGLYHGFLRDGVLTDDLDAPHPRSVSQPRGSIPPDPLPPRRSAMTTFRYPVDPSFLDHSPQYLFETPARPNHEGIDFQTPVGTTVSATADGEVWYIADEADGYGNVVRVQHPDGHGSLYAHLSRIDVSVGQNVNAGQTIGASGGAKGAPGSGDATGPHLHFGINTDGHNAWTDPLPLLDAAAEPAPSPEPAPPPAPGPSPAPPFPGVNLANYHEGDGTATWQAQMAARGWVIAVDDKFGPESESVARRFQAQKGLDVDGIVGPITWDAAWSAPVTPH